MKLTAILLSLVVLSPLAISADSLTGTWDRGDPEKGGGRLLTKHDGQRVRFQMECWRGAPSYNSGFVAGEFAVEAGKGTFEAKVVVGRCELHFAFSDQMVVIRYLNESTDCGFGYAVYANGKYRRTSRDEPSFSDGDPRQGPPLRRQQAVEGDAPDERRAGKGRRAVRR